jgi:hypothetical protein
LENYIIRLEEERHQDTTSAILETNAGAGEVEAENILHDVIEFKSEVATSDLT